MSDSIMQKLNEMQALTCSSSVPLGVSVARHTDRLLAETRRELRTCIDALKKIASYSSQYPCYCLEGGRPDPEGCYCSGDGHGPEVCIDCLAYELNEILTKALGVES